MKIKRPIDKPVNPNRISGLIGEDRARTTNMFLKGNVPLTPKDPIDISASADLIQRLPTHVKIKKLETPADENKEDCKINPYCLRKMYQMDMACAYQFWKLRGDHRLLIMFYYEKTHRDENGKEFKVLCFVEIVEIIITENTFRHIRGNLTASEIGRVKSNLLSWKTTYPEDEFLKADAEISEIREKYARILLEMNKRGGGIAVIGHHINPKIKDGIIRPDNKRLQPRLPLGETIAFAQKDNIGFGPGKYRNRFFSGAKLQDMVTIYHDNFYGLDLPWETRAKNATTPAKGWKRLERLNEPKPYPLPSSLPENEPKSSWYSWMLQNSGPGEEKAIAEGSLVIFIHPDSNRPNANIPDKELMRSIYFEKGDEELHRNVAFICRIFGAKYVEEGPCWFANYEQTNKIIAALSPRPIGQLPDVSQMQKLVSPGSWLFETHTGRYLLQRLQNKRYYISPQTTHNNEREVLRRRMSLAFHVGGLLSGHQPKVHGVDKNGNMLWSVEPSAGREAVGAIMNYTDIEVRK